MQVRVLGSAAGGGFPQWNCGCANCRAVRAGDARFSARAQDSIAVSADGQAWVVLNASPEIRAQIESFAPLHPRAARDTPIAALVLTNGDLDHTLGLFSLRESHPITVLSTAAVRAGILEANVMVRTLQRFEGQLTWNALALDAPFTVAGMSIELFTVAGKRPVHLEKLGDASPEDNVGVLVTDGAGKRVAYVPGVAAIDAPSRAKIEGADVVLFDGTFWSADELTKPGLMNKRAEDMAHWPVGGDDGSLATLAALRAGRKIYTHINNTNPILRDDSPERRAVEAAGVEVAYDGLTIDV
jgi:pyrroloquinoline quinone biosynthesis protein B